MTAVLAASDAEAWATAAMVCVAVTAVAAVLIALVLAPPRETTRTTRPPEWRNETTVTRSEPSDPKGEGK